MNNDSCSYVREKTIGSGKDFVPLRTTQDACKYLQCTARYLQRMVRSGRLRALKPTGKFLRFRQTDLDAFLETGATIGGDAQ
jgi:excisionase family DNA binding protein